MEAAIALYGLAILGLVLVTSDSDLLSKLIDRMKRFS
jgi:hypothetical protein